MIRENARFMPLLFPEKGIDVASPYTEQPEGTTPTGINVRLYEQSTQRGRGGSRPGITKYINAIVNPGLIQDLDTVVTTQPGGLGSSNYEAGGPGWTAMAFPGSYVLATTGTEIINGVPTPVWKYSAVLGVFPDGTIRESVIPTGVPLSTDIQPLAAPISLPANNFVLAYWQPGAFAFGTAPVIANIAFPIGTPSQGQTISSNYDFQDGNLFPGFGWGMINFPTGFDVSDFGFPRATTRGYAVPDPSSLGVPAAPFWNWPSGFQPGGTQSTSPLPKNLTAFGFGVGVLFTANGANGDNTMNGSVTGTLNGTAITVAGVATLQSMPFLVSDYVATNWGTSIQSLNASLACLIIEQPPPPNGNQLFFSMIPSSLILPQGQNHGSISGTWSVTSNQTFNQTQWGKAIVSVQRYTSTDGGVTWHGHFLGGIQGVMVGNAGQQNGVLTNPPLNILTFTF